MVFAAFILFLVNHIVIGYPGRSGLVGADHRKHRGINDELAKSAGVFSLTWHEDVGRFRAVILHEADKNVGRVLLQGLVNQDAG